jgi:hypothetical protein
VLSLIGDEFLWIQHEIDLTLLSICVLGWMSHETFSRAFTSRLWLPLGFPGQAIYDATDTGCIISK